MANSAIQVPDGAADLGGHLDTYRNKIINGQFDVWQRGTSGFTLIPSPNSFMYTADRWQLGISGAVGGTFVSNVTRQTFSLGQTDVPGNPSYYLDFQVYNLGSAFPDNVGSALIQRIENVSQFDGQTVTVSFWAKGSVPGPIAIILVPVYGISPRDFSTEPFQFINLTTAWQKFVLHFNLISFVGKFLASPELTHLALEFVTDLVNTAHDPTGSLPVYTGTVSLANVQLERGEEATDFELLPPEVVIGLCQRYYEEGFYDESAVAISNLPPNNEKWVEFVTTKRVIPSITADISETPPTGVNVQPGTVSAFTYGGLNGFGIRYASTHPLGAPWDTRVRSSLPDHLTFGPWKADAEL